MDDRSQIKRISEIFVSFLMLGFTSFGGPAAHLGYFNQEFVLRKKWATESQYAQWVALSQIVPGPGSSQVGFAIGYHHAGFLGGLAAFLAFTLPSFVVMVLLAKFGQAWQGSVLFDAVVHALKLLAVVVVADACLTMWRSFCQRKSMMLVALLSALFIIFVPFGLASIVVLLLAAGVGILSPLATAEHTEALPKIRFAYWLLVIALGIFGASFFVEGGLLGLFASFYQAGALVFGGGHVVLPMLSAFVSDTVSDSNLLLGYAAAQAVPGPMFTMASFLGAAAAPNGESGWLWAAVATLAVFSSGLLLMLSGQNVWQTLSTNVRFRSGVGSVNAAVVGILMAALYHPIASSSIGSSWDLACALVGFLWLKFKRPSIFLLIIAFILVGVLRSYL
ncbi:chromate efflux transporter [Marinomonas pollencensis]|uniref:Chromate transporter n=1 Tax=Marinomonas pollencensis TaxID=491954 RepID=A0A3E0DME6_9GAMM|nr:chromate efflux transporter [Marinomonas pollencensis]REG82688.1 chromate transporter [Marinomonas pollencensis]